MTGTRRDALRLVAAAAYPDGPFDGARRRVDERYRRRFPDQPKAEWDADDDFWFWVIATWPALRDKDFIPAHVKSMAVDVQVGEIQFGYQITSVPYVADSDLRDEYESCERQRQGLLRLVMQLQKENQELRDTLIRWRKLGSEYRKQGWDGNKKGTQRR